MILPELFGHIFALKVGSRVFDPTMTPPREVSATSYRCTELHQIKNHFAGCPLFASVPVPHRIRGNASPCRFPLTPEAFLPIRRHSLLHKAIKINLGKRVFDYFFRLVYP